MTLQEIRDRLIGETLVTSSKDGGYTMDTISGVEERAGGGYAIFVEGSTSFFISASAEKAELLARGTTINQDGSLIYLQEGRKKKIIDWEERTWRLACDIYLYERGSGFGETLMEAASQEARMMVESYKKKLEAEQ